MKIQAYKLVFLPNKRFKKFKKFGLSFLILFNFNLFVFKANFIISIKIKNKLIDQKLLLVLQLKKMLNIIRKSLVIYIQNR